MILAHKKIYAVYAEHDDITFIMEDEFSTNDELVSTAVVGWHYGKPDRKETPEYIGKLRATF